MIKDNTNNANLNFYKENILDKMLYVKTSEGNVIPMFIINIEENLNEGEFGTYTVSTFDVENNLMKKYTHIKKRWFDLAILACQPENLGTYVKITKLNIKRYDKSYEDGDSYAIMAL